MIRKDLYQSVSELYIRMYLLESCLVNGVVQWVRMFNEDLQINVACVG